MFLNVCVGQYGEELILNVTLFVVRVWLDQYKGELILNVTFFKLLYIEHAPLPSVVLRALLQFLYMYSLVIKFIHCLLSTLLHVIKFYIFYEPVEDLLLLVD